MTSFETPEPDDEIEELEAFDLDDSDFSPLAIWRFTRPLKDFQWQTKLLI